MPNRSFGTPLQPFLPHGPRPLSDAAASLPPDFAPLRTARLTLRPLRAADAADLHRLVNDWEVAKTLARVPFPYPRELADEWIASTWAQIAAGHGLAPGHRRRGERRRRCWSAASA